MRTLGLVGACVVLGAACVNAQTGVLNWREETYEPIPPLLYPALSGAKATATGQFGACKPDYAIDGDTNAHRHWGCEQLPSALTIELAKPTLLKQGRIIFYYADGRTYQFYVERSMDNKTWTKIADWTGNKLPSTAEGFSLPFEPQGEGKFIRITVTESSKHQNGAHIVEFSLGDKKPVARGFHGRVADTERISAENAMGDENRKVWRATAWRNERVNGQFVLWSGGKVPQMRLEASALTTDDGKCIPASAVTPRFVRHVLANGEGIGDILDTAERVDLPAGGYRAVWLTVTVPETAPAGVYRGSLTVTGSGRDRIVFPLELTVLSATLPSPKTWAFHLDIWQHPWAVARYHGVKPFSHLHYQLLEPIYRELANAGQKALTTTLTDLPWNHQNFDAYHTMIEHIRNADGTWTNDYTLFDEYVAFGRRCGIGPYIHCYTMATWGNRVYYVDGPTGDRVCVKLVPGTAEPEAFWGPFLTDFQKHLIEKGWVDNTYIAMDERSREEVMATAKCVQKYAPRLKLQMAGNRAPSAFAGIDLFSYCQSIHHVSDEFVKETAQRRAKGMITTFYVCCSPDHPNTFTASPTAEQVWLGYFAAAKGLDGFLRWAFVNWPRDPLFDTSFGNWPAGDTFFLYPGLRSSIRWEMLRDGIEEYEKIRWLRSHGADMTAINKLLATYDFAKNRNDGYEPLRRQIAETRAAVETAAKKCR